MLIDWTLVARWGAPLVALFVGAALNRLLERRSRLVTYMSHSAAIQIRRPDVEPLQFHTHSVVVRNAGRNAAHNLRLGHTILPDFSIYPPTEHRVVDVGGGREIVIPVLVPKEQITIAYLYLPPLLWQQVNTYTKSDEGIARTIQVLPTPLPSRWVARGALLLIAIGVLTLIFIGVEAVLTLFRFMRGG